MPKLLSSGLRLRFACVCAWQLLRGVSSIDRVQRASSIVRRQTRSQASFVIGSSGISHPPGPSNVVEPPSSQLENASQQHRADSAQASFPKGHVQAITSKAAMMEVDMSDSDPVLFSPVVQHTASETVRTANVSTAEIAKIELHPQSISTAVLHHRSTVPVRPLPNSPSQTKDKSKTQDAERPSAMILGPSQTNIPSAAANTDVHVSRNSHLHAAPTQRSLQEVSKSDQKRLVQTPTGPPAVAATATLGPSAAPAMVLTPAPTLGPSVAPAMALTPAPGALISPTVAPTVGPSLAPTVGPSFAVTAAPVANATATASDTSSTFGEDVVLDIIAIVMIVALLGALFVMWKIIGQQKPERNSDSGAPKNYRRSIGRAGSRRSDFRRPDGLASEPDVASRANDEDRSGIQQKAPRPSYRDRRQMTSKDLGDTGKDASAGTGAASGDNRSASGDNLGTRPVATSAYRARREAALGPSDDAPDGSF